MELALSLGDSSQSLPSFLSKTPKPSPALDFCIGLALGGGSSARSCSASETRKSGGPVNDRCCGGGGGGGGGGSGSSDSSSLLQLDLLPSSHVPRSCNSSTGNGSSHFPLPWLAERLVSEPESSSGRGKNLDVNRFPVPTIVAEDQDDAAAQSSSPNSAVSSFQMEFGMALAGGGSKRSEPEGDADRDCSRGSDDDENGLTRKKLRLSKEQSAFLEESFKEQSTLNPKQKIALAKQLNLRPRQVEVWFQNRRARTKLKQTEIDCEYLKRCCETLTEENRRLQKELQELRALKSAPPFYMQLPATTLTMCPSCERVATATTTGASPPGTNVSRPRPRSYPFGGGGPVGQQQGKAQGGQGQGQHPSDHVVK
ncbi:hypothetical protein MLD38_033174 [Melastoma candidum]|uniref:Uncharacterized protein n=1 Tax=Melastoma candidum TaxID=119954 RepID=A0ACB9M7Z4_9MYRT|nr:hypothetical protein MLD38_033174 [Melastoma candidum]